jgi:tetratricopeptide (TPR) repeat protein
MYSERFEENKTTIETGLKLIPFRPVNFVNMLGWVHVGLEEYDKAIPLLTEVVKRAPKSFFAYLSYRGLVVSYELSGNHQKAMWAAENVMRINPNFSIEKDRKSSALIDGEFKARIYDAFQRAGLE